MRQLEMVYLMKVSLHLNTMKDVMVFESINKKCSTAIHSLKVNPWFKNKEDIEKFYEIFEQTTCNCNGFQINDTILLKAERIRNYSFGTISPKNFSILDDINGVMKKEKQKLELIFSKLESIKTNKIGSEEEFELLIQNMKSNIKIECEDIFFIKFENAYREFKKMKLEEKESKYDLVFYPKQFIIQMFNQEKVEMGIFDLFQKSNQDKIICIWNRNIDTSELENKIISSQVKNYFFFNNYELMEKNKNVVFMMDYKKGCNFVVFSEDIVDEKKRMQCLDLINKVYATKIKFHCEARHQLFDIKKIKLPECVKEIDSFTFSNVYKLPFSLEGIEVLNHDGILEINEKNDLKVLNLRVVDGINYYEKGSNKRKWGNENTIDYFQKLTKLDMGDCRNIEILSKLKNLEYLILFKCQLCHINIDSKNLKEINLNCNKSKIKLKMYRNDINFIISNCISVDIEIECEEGIKPNIKITNCKELKIKSNKEIGNIVIDESKIISFNEGFKCELIQLNNSEIIEGIIEAKVVGLLNVTGKCPINLNKANEIVIANMNNCILEGMFESCKKLIINECNECKFDIGNNQIEEMKVIECKSTNIEGTLPNIKSIVSIENNECKIPITNNIITTDEEIIELKENLKIVTYKKHLIIRNGKDVKCEIESLIKSDITFENCHNVDVMLKNEIIGILEFNNCDSFINTTQLFTDQVNVGCLGSLIVYNSKKLNFYVEKINNMIKLKDSDVDLDFGDFGLVFGIVIKARNFIVNNIEIENSTLSLQRDILSKKCVIINSKTELNNIINSCQEELVLKKINGIDIGVCKQLKMITIEDCSKIQCPVNLKGKEVKLIRCSDMILSDTSKSIKMESCRNIKVNGQNFIEEGLELLLSNNNVDEPKKFEQQPK